MIEVAAGLIVRNGRILLTRRAPGQKLEGLWEFPGGKLEEGESPQVCLEREIMEELGLRIRAGEVVTKSSFSYPHATITLLAIRAEYLGGEFALTVHDAAEWVEPHALLSFDLAPADIPIAEFLSKAGIRT